MAGRERAGDPARAYPELGFAVEEAGVWEYAAAPTLRFRVRVDSLGGQPIRSVLLTTQIRIAVTRRAYDAESQARLVEVFGEPSQWGQTLRSLLWTHTTLNVTAFTGSTIVEMPVSCTYDFEVASAKYLHALRDGEVPLEFLFSGTIFYTGDDGLLRTALVSWEKEAEFRLPVRVWREAMEHFFPGSAWLRLRTDTFDRLHAYRGRRALPSWEAAVEALLRSDAEPGSDA
jgi:hypothetical protein